MVIAHEEFVATEIGQVGTQFDGLAHIGVQRGGAGNDDEKRFYNGMPLTEIYGSYGFKKLGVENVKPFFTPAVMFDIRALKGRPLNRGEEITVKDLKDALARQELPDTVLTPGDVVLIRTGWGDQWMVDNESYYNGEPGIGLAATEWLIDKGVSLIASDNWAVEVLPNPDPDLAYPVHQLALTKHGVYLFENLSLDALSEDRVYQAAFAFSPVPIKGATGSPGNPIVVR
jgi:kynurenine formamidase